MHLIICPKIIWGNRGCKLKSLNLISGSSKNYIPSQLLTHLSLSHFQAIPEVAQCSENSKHWLCSSYALALTFTNSAGNWLHFRIRGWSFHLLSSLIMKTIPSLVNNCLFTYSSKHLMVTIYQGRSLAQAM